MNTERLKNHIETTLLFTQAVAGHSGAKQTSVTMLTDNGNIETTLADLAQVVHNVWVEFVNNEWSEND